MRPNRILEIGVHPRLSPRDASYVILLNRLVVLTVLFIALQLPFGTSLPVTTSTQLVMITVYICTLGLNFLRQYRAARLLFAGSSICGLIELSWTEGHDTYVHLFLVVVALGSWVINPPESRTISLMSTLLTLAVFLVLEFELVPPSGFALGTAPELVAHERRLSIIGSFLLSMGFGYWSWHRAQMSEDQLDEARRSSEELLLNILPMQVAERLKVSKVSIAERIDEASIVFADIVNFTALAERLPATELVELLDRVFSTFDGLADRYGLEKIKTIGDAYMAAAGVPTPRIDHLEAAADMALAMRDELRAFVASSAVYAGIDVRIGVHTGPVVAGVIGKRKFAYDLWGDAVNLASRLESHGEPGRVHVSKAVYDGLAGAYRFESRGIVRLKGKGELATWFLEGRA